MMRANSTKSEAFDADVLQVMSNQLRFGFYGQIAIHSASTLVLFCVIAIIPASSFGQGLQACRMLTDAEAGALRVVSPGDALAPFAHSVDERTSVRIEQSSACRFRTFDDTGKLTDTGALDLTLSRAHSTRDAIEFANTLQRKLLLDPSAPTRPNGLPGSCVADDCAFVVRSDKLVLSIHSRGVATPAVRALRDRFAVRLLDPESSCASADLGRVPALWMDTDPEPLTLELLARRMSPILWFSPREPIDHPRPRVMPQHSWDVYNFGSSDDNDKPQIYYKVRRITLRDASDPARDAVDTYIRPHDPAGHRELSLPWTRGGLPLGIELLDRIAIRYMFYFPSDAGIGEHIHDLEAAEFTAKILPCRTAIDGPCVYKAVLVTVTTSAHGVGWYTGILDVCSAVDTRLPVTLLVEEGKHATAPDRDGDGEFKPHYDVNVYSNDAWGVRDTAATKRLGGTSFRAEMTKRRPYDTQVFPDVTYINERIRESSDREYDGMTFSEVEAINTGNDIKERSKNYLLLWAPGSALCANALPSEGSMRAQRLQRFIEGPDNRLPTTEEGKAARKLFELLDGKGFCTGEEIVNPSEFGHRLARFLNTISPGPKNEYGFMSEWQRLSFSYRHDGGPGLSGIVPLGLEVPSIGGWLVGKIDATISDWNGKAPDRVRLLSVNMMYSPSASRFADWYYAVGPQRSSEDRTVRWTAAQELGVRFRFALLRSPLFKFYGGRIGLRTDSVTRPRNTRLVFEVGAGSW